MRWVLISVVQLVALFGLIHLPIMAGLIFIGVALVSGAGRLAYVWDRGKDQRELALVQTAGLALMMGILTLWIPGAWTP